MEANEQNKLTNKVETLIQTHRYSEQLSEERSWGLSEKSEEIMKKQTKNSWKPDRQLHSDDWKKGECGEVGESKGGVNGDGGRLYLGSQYSIQMSIIKLYT